MSSSSTTMHGAPAALGLASHLSDHDLDSDSIMTDEIDEDDSRVEPVPSTGTIDPSTLMYSTSGPPVASTSGTSGLSAAATASSIVTAATSTSKAPSTSRLSSTTNTRPSGPVCEFGERLGYTYFSKPVPTADELNAAHKHTETFWLTVDNDLTYLSFFRDTGPVSASTSQL